MRVAAWKIKISIYALSIYIRRITNMFRNKFSNPHPINFDLIMSFYEFINSFMPRRRAFICTLRFAVYERFPDGG